MSTRRSAASVLARLLDLAKQRGEDYSLLLNRFGLERLLDRLTKSRHADRFLLKAPCSSRFGTTNPIGRRALGFGPDDAEHLVAVFREIAAIELDDGIVFDPDSVRVDPLREDNVYGGSRLRLVGHVGKSRCSLQVDVGFGGAVTPSPETARYPVLLPDFDRPTLRVYPVYTVIAEKYQAMVMLGAANSRMKDFYDLCMIASRTSLDGQTLARAITATFTRRTTEIPAEPPLALRPAFSNDPAKQQQWRAFLSRNRLGELELAAAIELLYALLWPPTQVAGSASDATARWDAAQLKWV
jgi:hypothetical protein